MVVKKNEGRLFEATFEKSIKSCEEKIFYIRIKDVSIPPDLRARISLPKNKFDCFMFTRSHLFTFELKSTKQKSISFDEKIIKQHQIDNLIDCDTYPGIISGFIFNFREPLNRVFFVPIKEFADYKHVAQNNHPIHKYKSKVNKSSISISICEEIGIEIMGYKKRVNWHYHIEDFVTEAINECGINMKASN
jgi:Penicillin-binding protein-related factor A, putative recombinase